jgi:carbon-monoxide dehydrogenase medium subunit
MYATQTEYYRADSVDNAISLLTQHEDAKILAGGHSLIPLMKLRLAAPAALIDIGRIGSIKGVDQGDATITIGALTTHAEIAASDAVKTNCPILAEAAGMVGDPAVRNRGTIGGNIAHSDPASDLPAVLTALNARLNITGPNGTRREPVSGFIEGLMQNNLEATEIMTSVEVPRKQPYQGMAYAKFEHPASRYAVVGAAAMVTVTDGKCTAASVAIGGVESKPTVGNSVQASLIGSAPTDAVLDEAANSILDDIGDDVLGDIFASAEYRKAMTVVYLRKALVSAVERAG